MSEARETELHEKITAGSQTSLTSMLMIIVDYGNAGKVTGFLKTLGIARWTVLIGRGSVSHRLLNRLGFTDEQKDIILAHIPESDEESILEALNRKFNFKKPNSGIAITAPVLGTFEPQQQGEDANCADAFHETDRAKSEFTAVISVVDRGKAMDLIETGKEMGCPRGTIIKARGSTEYSTNIFHMSIQPEKEVVFQIVHNRDAMNLAARLSETYEFAKPNQGILIMIGISRTLGLSHDYEV